MHFYDLAILEVVLMPGSCVPHAGDPDMVAKDMSSEIRKLGLVSFLSLSSYVLGFSFLISPEPQFLHLYDGDGNTHLQRDCGS